MKFSPFVLLCSTGLFAIFSSTISKSPVLPMFASHLGADASGVGMVAAISAFTGIVASIPAGILSDRWGRRRMLVISAIIFSTAPFLYLFVTNIWQLALVRFYHGFATALFIPVSMALVSDLFHTERGEKMGWFSTSTLLGRFAAPVAGGSIIAVFASNPAMSYRAVYMVCGAAGLIVLFLAFRLPAVGTEVKISRDWKETFRSFKAVLYRRGILMTSSAEAAILFAYGTFETFLPLYSIKIGLSPFDVGIFLSAQVITLALTKPAMGRFSDRHGRKPQIVAGGFIGSFCIASLPFFDSFFPLLILSILFGLSLSIVTSASAALIADLSRKETHGSAMGILGSVMDIGHTAGPFVSGFIVLHFGFTVSFIGAALVLAAAAALFRIRV
jgi:MFS transporter, DHA1 family, multidrug resistance protein